MEGVLVNHPNAYIIIGEGFNSRIGPDGFYLYSKYGPHPFCPANGEPLMRCRFKDHKENYTGFCLKRITEHLGLHILNGAISGDYPAVYTYLAGARMSTIDYFIVAPGLLSFITKMDVIPRFFSNHFPLKLL